MFAWLNWKSYSMIAIGFGLFIYVIGFFAAPPMISFLLRIDRAAQSGGLGGTIVGLVIDPLVYGLQNPLVGAIVGGLFWPLLLLWIILVLLLMIIAFVGGGLNRAEDSGLLR